MEKDKEIKLPWNYILDYAITSKEDSINMVAIPEHQAQAGYEGAKEVIMADDMIDPESSEYYLALEKAIQKLKEFVGEGER